MNYSNYDRIINPDRLLYFSDQYEHDLSTEVDPSGIAHSDN